MAASLELAITAIRAGRKEEGRQLLNLLIQQDPNNDMAWLWMSSVVNTDEQRARCLYHVLAINPDNELARRGLKILGIVVTDSRPVKIPRDSQPIRIPKPTPVSQPAYPSVVQVEQVAPAEERRPFRIDPQAIVDELPFTPVREPFATTLQPAQSEVQPIQPASPSEPVALPQTNVATDLVAPSPTETKPLPTMAEPAPVAQSEQSPSPSEPEPIVPADLDPAEATSPPEEASEQVQTPSEPVPVVQPELNAGPIPQPQMKTEQFQTPSEPVPVIQPNADIEEIPATSQSPSEPVPAVGHNMETGMMPTPAQLETGPLPTPSEPVPVIQPNQGMVQPPPQVQTGQVQSPSEPVPVNPAYYPQYPLAGPMSLQETRPTQPLPTPQANATQVLPQQSYQLPPPAGATATGHSNVTAGMPTHYLAAQNPSQPVPGFHSNPTMGITSPGQPAEQVNGQAQHPSQPVPAIHSNGTVAMPLYPQPQFQPVMPQNPAIHSNATMVMPAGYISPATLSAPLNRDYRVANAAARRPGAKRVKRVEQEEDGDEVNILAVIIFGSLSVTALGGLGMLILLMFTAV